MSKSVICTDRQVYGYLRVSTSQQEINQMKDSIIEKAKTLDIDPEKIIFYEETITGRLHWSKRKLGELLDMTIKGDVIIMSELSRIGRTISIIMSFCSKCIENGILLYFVFNDLKIDNSINSQMLLFSYSLCSQIERDLISQRTKTALDHKRAQGVSLGRPKGSSKLDKYKTELQQYIKLGTPQSKLCAKFNVNKSTMSSYVRKHFKKQYVDTEESLITDRSAPSQVEK